MAAPSITPIAPAPDPLAPPDEFDADATAFVNDLPGLVLEMNALVAWINGNIVATNLKTVTDENYDLAAGDSSKYIIFTFAGAKAIFVRPESSHAMSAGATWTLRNDSSGVLEIEEGSGVIIKPPSGGSLFIPQDGTATLVRVSANTYHLMGQTEAG